jgi:leader peptidase (prepilin peptidase)/N-methyltransferase
VVGLLFGSFLNVCISRLPAHESIATPRSHCMACGHTIRWYDNVPVLSWVMLRGRCRDCSVGVSWRYPAVEIAFASWLLVVTALCFRASLVGLYVQLAGAQQASIVLLGISLAIAGFLLIGLMVMDWQTQRLPNAFTLTGIVIGILLVCVRAFFLAPSEGDIVLNTTHQLRLSSPGSFTAHGNVFLTGTEALIMGRLAAIAGAALLLLTVRWIYKAVRKQDGMGLGDVKLLAMIAAFLGFGESLVALFLGVVAASLYGLTMVARGKARGATRLPFGSFLAAGGLFAALFGAEIVGWYSDLLR